MNSKTRGTTRELDHLHRDHAHYETKLEFHDYIIAVVLGKFGEDHRQWIGAQQ